MWNQCESLKYLEQILKRASKKKKLKWDWKGNWKDICQPKKFCVIFLLFMSYFSFFTLCRYGLNKLPDPPSKSAIKMLLGQLSDFMVLILLTVGIISLAMMDWIEAVVLFLVVISNVLIGFYQEFKAERTLQALKSFSVQAATVLRDGEVRDVEAEQLVPGLKRICFGNQMSSDFLFWPKKPNQLTEFTLTIFRRRCPSRGGWHYPCWSSTIRGD